MKLGSIGGFRTALAAALLASGIAAGCSSTKTPARPADDLYGAAKEDQEKESYELAINEYKELLDNYPLDPRAEEVELLIAQAHYANKAYPEAIAAFTDFQRMHPTSPHLPEVEYTIGLAYADQINTVDRDLSAASNASAHFESVMARYPTSEFAAKAREQLGATRDHMASRELYVADFYYKRGKTDAGNGRIAELLVKYPETPAATEGLARLKKEAEGSGDTALASAADAALAERQSASGAAAATTDRPGRPSAAVSNVIDELRTRGAKPTIAAGGGASQPAL
jgi:outer membrane protein assembly factor BamD